MVTHDCSPSYSGGWGRRIAWTWEAKVAVSRDDTTAFQPEQQSKTLSQNKKKVLDSNQWGMVAHVCNPSTSEGWGRQITWGQEFKTSLTKMVNLVSMKNTKINQMWYHTPVISATWEAEAQKSLEPGRQRLQWAKIMPLHSSLGNRVRLCLKNNNNKIMKIKIF